MKTNINNPFWGEGEKKDFGKVAIDYAAGEDVVLDQKLVQYECLVDQAHVVMLYKKKIITKSVVSRLLTGLEEIKKLDKTGKFLLKKELEDVHSNVEHYLIEKFGLSVGGYLRLGIARNDQVYTDTRMWMRDKILSLSHKLLKLLRSLTQKAEENITAVMPGYTHLRISQPISYGHYLMAKAFHFYDDLCNLLITYEIVNICPLGIFEMAGTQLPIDRILTAKLLGFDGITPNSLYTANLRGELEAKLLADLTLLAMHIRRTMNELIIFSTHEFGLLQIDSLYTTGGTAQPNLQNPDTLEVVRANMVRVTGAFMGTLMMMDTLPSGFNRDTQQTKPILFQTVALMEETLPVVTGILGSLKPDKKRMEIVANMNFATAPDLSVQLAVKGEVSFREAYKVVKVLIKEKLQRSFLELNPNLIAQVSLAVLGKKIKVTQKDLDAVSTARSSVERHTSEGGPAPSEIEKEIKDLKIKIEIQKDKISTLKTKLTEAYQLLGKEIRFLLNR